MAEKPDRSDSVGREKVQFGQTESKLDLKTNKQALAGRQIWLLLAHTGFAVTKRVSCGFPRFDFSLDAIFHYKTSVPLLQDSSKGARSPPDPAKRSSF